jgi:uncharacterized protein YqeY
MSLITQIKSLQLVARKAHNTMHTALYTTLLGDALMPGKNDGSRESTDAEVTAIIKKYVKNIETMPDAAKTETSAAELVLLMELLPQQLNETQLREVICGLHDSLQEQYRNVKGIMTALNNAWPGQYDGAVASKIIKEVLGG